MYREDTIAAISTPLGRAGIGVIRTSGVDAIEIVSKVFKAKKLDNLKKARTYRAYYGHIIDPESGKIVDEVICLVMKAPYSFTREDVVEIHCHGGFVTLEKIMELLLSNGARLAEPGEFSRRAFLNGRIDLAQAEAILEVINAKTEKGLEVAVGHLQGDLSREVDRVKDKMVRLLAHLEATIDFPEDEIPGFNSGEIEGILQGVIQDLKDLLASAKKGKLYREGIQTAIVGKPNVGKSSLLNALLKENRAIVTSIPGTTRDIIEEFINLEGIPLKIIDTAGIRETEDEVEKIGVEKTKEVLKKADLVLFVLDISDGLSDEDRQIMDFIERDNVIVILNKMDLEIKKVDREQINKYLPDAPVVYTSMLEKEGLDELENVIRNMVLGGEVEIEEGPVLSSTRHKSAIKRALNSVQKVLDALESGLPYDFLTIDLKDSISALGEITGETLAEDIIDRIFSEFCIGK